MGFGPSEVCSSPSARSASLRPCPSWPSCRHSVLPPRVLARPLPSSLTTDPRVGGNRESRRNRRAFRGFSWTGSPTVRRAVISPLCWSRSSLGFQGPQGFPSSCHDATNVAPPLIRFSLRPSWLLRLPAFQSLNEQEDWLDSFESAAPLGLPVLVFLSTPPK